MEREVSITGRSGSRFQRANATSSDVRVPVTMQKEMEASDSSALDNRGDWRLTAVGRLRPGFTRAQAEAVSQPVGRWLPAAVLGLSGFAALVYEVTFTRVLAIALGPTTYAFAAMLTAFIGGLALGACLGGNGTLIGASANLTVAGIAERNGVSFRFMPFLKLAFPMMLISIAIAMVYIYLRYLI